MPKRLKVDLKSCIQNIDLSPISCFKPDLEILNKDELKSIFNEKSPTNSCLKPSLPSTNKTSSKSTDFCSTRPIEAKNNDGQCNAQLTNFDYYINYEKYAFSYQNEKLDSITNYKGENYFIGSINKNENTDPNKVPPILINNFFRLDSNFNEAANYDNKDDLEAIRKIFTKKKEQKKKFVDQKYKLYTHQDINFIVTGSYNINTEKAFFKNNNNCIENNINKGKITTPPKLDFSNTTNNKKKNNIDATSSQSKKLKFKDEMLKSLKSFFCFCFQS